MFPFCRVTRTQDRLIGGSIVDEEAAIPVQTKYLLYLDVLGFKELVREYSPKLDQIFHTINKFIAADIDKITFECIVFSDTILVYNKYDPTDMADKEGHSYLVQCLIGFAQGLLLQFIGKDLFFRGSLSYGKFTHYQMEHIDCFYGPALIDAYQGEKEIPAIGLFLHKSALAHNKMYSLTNFSKNYYFVYLDSLNYLFKKFGPFNGGGFPIKDERRFENAKLAYPIAHDIVMLKAIHEKMSGEPDPSVRAKFLASWQMYRQRYPDFLQALEVNNFSFETVCSGYDWSEAEKRVYED